ncbi:hypothetical protein SALBM135S_09585 [Streptomyces alboniger]
MVCRSAQMLVALFVGKRSFRRWIVSDELWSLVEPLLPEPGAKLVAGRPRVADRQALCGTLFVVRRPSCSGGRGVTARCGGRGEILGIACSGHGLLVFLEGVGGPGASWGDPQWVEWRGGQGHEFHTA